MEVAVYVSHLNKIGGVETFAINLCNRTGFDLIFDKAAFSQLKKLQHNAYQIDYLTKTYDVLIIGSAWGRNPDTVKAEKYIQVIHADYRAYIEHWNFTYNKLPYTTHHVAVGHHVAKQFEIVTGYKIDCVINNLLEKGKTIPKPTIPKEPLRLVTLSRFSKEKGFERMIELSKMIDIPFVWDVYGDTSTPYAKNIIPQMRKFNIKGVTSIPVDVIPNYHYVVQLSDTEGFPYAVYESLQCLTPVISTDYPSVHEMIKDGKNGYILPMDLSGWEKIKKVPVIKTFKEKSSQKDWFNFLNEIL